MQVGYMILGSYRFICTLKEAKQECNVVLLAFISRTSVHVYLLVFLTVSWVPRLLLELEMSLRPQILIQNRELCNGSFIGQKSCVY
jgi:hypothetical protein